MKAIWLYLLSNNLFYNLCFLQSVLLLFLFYYDIYFLFILSYKKQDTF